MHFKKGRLVFIYLLMTFGLIFLSGKVLYLKTVKGEIYEKAALNQQINRYDNIIPPDRGNILDRNMHELAQSISVYNVILDPIVLNDKNTNPEKNKERQETTVAAINQVLGISKESLWEHLKTDEDGVLLNQTHYIRIARMIPREQAEELKEMELFGLWLEEDTKRVYPLKSTAANVVGYIRGDSKSGLELSYDAFMRGENGRTFLIYDNTTTPTMQQIPAMDGNTVVTSLDLTIQQYAEEAIRNAVAQYEPESAAVLAMNPNTGEILAMANYPAFDPNDPTIPIYMEEPAFAEKWNALSEEDQMHKNYSMWRNYCVSDSFEPGSIFKPMAAAMALEEGAILPNDIFICNGKKDIYGQEVNCHKKTGHGPQTLEEALANSCNVAVMDMVAKIGAEKFHEYFVDFGYGQKTGIDMPGEATGFVYTLEQMKNPVNLSNSAFGQGSTSTAVQNAVAFSSVINGGRQMRPYIVSHIIDGDGNIVKENKPAMMRQVISQETSDIIRTYLQSVVETGTGSGARIDGYAIGGKTGTGQQVNAQGTYDEELVTLDYVAYLPVENPQLLAIVVIDKPKEYIEGLTSPAPMMREFLENAIQYLGIEKTGVQSGVPVPNTASGITLPDYTGETVDIVTQSLSQNGLKYIVIGQGSEVTNQWPAPDTIVTEGASINIYVHRGQDDADMRPIPNVVGMSNEDACTMLINAGFSPVIEEYGAGGNQDALYNKMVISQIPAGLVYQRPNSEVTIKLGEAEDMLSEESTE